jgi:hypothetical protein
MAKWSKEFLEHTVQVWQTLSSISLTLEDARDLAENMTELFSLLKELHMKYEQDSTNTLCNTNEDLIEKKKCS